MRKNKAKVQASIPTPGHLLIDGGPRGGHSRAGIAGKNCNRRHTTCTVHTTKPIAAVLET